MGIVRGSHRGPLYSLRDSNGAWTGALSDQEVEETDLSRVRWLAGPRGSITVHSCRAVHGSKANLSPRMRPLLQHTNAPADDVPLTRIMDPVRFANIIVRGAPATRARFSEEPCPMPPNWGAGEYKSIFSAQQEKVG